MDNIITLMTKDDKTIKSVQIVLMLIPKNMSQMKVKKLFT